MFKIFFTETVNYKYLLSYMYFIQLVGLNFAITGIWIIKNFSCW